LIYKGSKNFPYNGTLAAVANRSFADGLMGLTSEDHTLYSVETVGEQGFLQLLPVYMDHIFFPGLTDNDFFTEVHHIDPKGKNAGVVYSEMAGRESSSNDLTWTEMLKHIHSEGSGYRFNTGGTMSELRKLEMQEIRNYHAKNYVPHNATVVVVGKFSDNVQSILSVLQKQVEPNLVKKQYSTQGWKRPLFDSPSFSRPSFKEHAPYPIKFPSDQDESGEVLFVFKGPSYNSFLEKYVSILYFNLCKALYTLSLLNT
ncbi:Metalloenzyme, LuxS/M16 peptidase-like protein, partial [Phellopilus nigrolimitatus]